MASKIDGLSLAYAVSGAIVLWSGIKGSSISDTVRSVIKGSTTPPVTEQVGVGSASSTGSTGGVVNVTGNPSGGSNSQNQALGRMMAASYGWGSGAEWTALNNIVMAESGWSSTAANPTSNARGIAQNINGWSANYQEGNAQQQIAWLLSYIKGRYGDPINAWNFHLANGWY